MTHNNQWNFSGVSLNIHLSFIVVVIVIIVIIILKAVIVLRQRTVLSLVTCTWFATSRYESKKKERKKERKKDIIKRWI